MKVTTGTMFGCALWLQRQLGYSRYRCGVVSRRSHICVCDCAMPVCVEP